MLPCLSVGKWEFYYHLEGQSEKIQEMLSLWNCLVSIVREAYLIFLHVYFGQVCVVFGSEGGVECHLGAKR